MSHIESKVTEVKKPCSFINNAHEKHVCGLRKPQPEVYSLEKSCKTLESNIITLSTDKDQLKYKVNDLETRSMRENLMFYWLRETRSEDCDAEIKNFCRDKLDMEASSMIFDRVHRFSGVTARNPLQIVAKFHKYHEREQLRQKCSDRNNKLKAASQSVGIHRPKAVWGTRKKLYSIMKKKEKKMQGKMQNS